NQKLILNVRKDSAVLGDKDKLHLVFDHLISNAIRFSVKGKTIEVTLREEPGKAIFEVVDQGKGLTQEDQEKLFLKYAKLSAQPDVGENATRTGLFIVKSLVNLHRGNVRGGSKGENLGSVFTVEIPLFQ
ncbi:MAG: ATP-binding protein, partial [Crocinitomicaceae bacterium]|nr:ATP-binding protein [Crocinitomicaceae bacterium]